MLHFNLRLFTMMNIRVKLLVAIILYQFFLFVHAQGLIDVRHYSIEDGLSQNIVQDMLQDDDGYIWLATWNGLEKYDGYTFKNYKSYPTDAIKLKYNRMVQVIKGSDHTLWCHTYDDKVYLFDTQRERFEDVFVYHPQIEECDLVEKLIPLNNGIVWVVASDGNLWRIDEADYQKDNGVIFLSSGSVPQHGNHVYSVVLDAYNNEWILTDKGCFVYGKRELSDKRDFKYAVSLNHQFYMATSSGEIVLYTSKGGIKEVNFERIDWDIMGLLALKDGKMGVITKRGVIVVDTYNNHVENILIDKSSSDISPSGFFQSTDNKLWMFNGKSNVVCCDLKHNDATWPMTFWLAGAAWYSLFYYDYYMYTLDKDFLRERALPFMEQAALFYEDFLKEGNDGKYIFNPSYSPENNPANSSSQACVNATMDVMAANGLLRSVIEASQILGVNQDKIPVWKAMQEKMPSYMLNENGEIREWMWKDLQDNHKHRHASHLFGLYDFHDPLIMGNQDLIEGCKRAINRRMEIRRQDNGGIMAFGMVQLAFAACALGETEMAYDMLVWLGNSYWNNNLVSTHDPKKTFNLDICGGYPSLVMKMMVYSEPGVISLLPCKPVQWKNGTIKGIALRGGILLQELVWHEKEVKATLLSKINQTVKIQLQGIDKQEIALKAGEPVTVVF